MRLEIIFQGPRQRTMNLRLRESKKIEGLLTGFLFYYLLPLHEFHKRYENLVKARCSELHMRIRSERSKKLWLEFLYKVTGY
jgi:hypothetical protein